jgi:hypothetical protein
VPTNAASTSISLKVICFFYPLDFTEDSEFQNGWGTSSITKLSARENPTSSSMTQVSVDWKIL